jgi:hypothetical protein
MARPFPEITNSTAAAISRKLRGRHVSMKIDVDATIEDVVFSVWTLSR